MSALRALRLCVALATAVSAALVLGWLGSCWVPGGKLTSPILSMLQSHVAASSLQTTTTIHISLVSRCWTGYVPPYGAQFYGSLSGDSGLAQIAGAGGRWVRVPVSWSAVEPTDGLPDSYLWTGLDTSVISATEKGVGLVLTIAGQPSWAAVYEMGPVTDTADIIEFVGALVERYDGDGSEDAPGSPTVRYFELYNEPDNADEGHAEHGGWGYWGHNGSGYAALLQALHGPVKAASQSANLVFGGVALDWFEPDGPFDPQFLDDVLAACQGQECFDVMNFHYYPPFWSNWEPYGPGIIGKAIYVRQRLAAYGFADVPVICTETGWHSGVTWGSDELQSRYVVKAAVRSMAADLSIVVWYKATDAGDSGLPGLLAADLEPKPSLNALQTMAAALEGALYDRALTSGETGSDQIEGYVFSQCGRRIDVVWTEDSTWQDPEDDSVLSYSAVATTLCVSDKYGAEVCLDDADDGLVDGRVTVLVGGSPLFLQYQ